MDINLLSKLIKESLFDQDRVVISGIGYFTTEQIAAKFSEDGKSILPPHLKISFTLDTNIDDDHLKKLYIHKADAKSEEAAAQWESFMEEFKENLKKEEKIEIPQIGELFYNGNNTLEFSTHDNGTLFQTVYGLEQIPIKPLTNTIPVIEMGDNLDIRNIKNESESNIGTKEEENPATPIEDEAKIETEASAEQIDVAERTGDTKESTEVASQTENQTEEADSETTSKDNEAEKTPKDNESEITQTPDTEDSTQITEITSDTAIDSTSDSTVKTVTDSAPNTSEEGNEDTLPAVGTKKSHLLRNTIIIIAAMIIIVIAAIIILGQQGILDNILYTPEELELIDKYGN